MSHLDLRRALKESVLFPGLGAAHEIAARLLHHDDARIVDLNVESVAQRSQLAAVLGECTVSPSSQRSTFSYLGHQPSSAIQEAVARGSRQENGALHSNGGAVQLRLKGFGADVAQRHRNNRLENCRMKKRAKKSQYSPCPFPAAHSRPAAPRAA
jgi:hypothetical protein